MSEKSKFRFDDRLLDHIKFGQNSEAKLMLTKELAKKADSLGTLLHRAAYYDNVEILQYLIDLRSNLDFLGEGGRTPLMIAVQNECVESVKVLLKAGASADIVNAKGQSAVKMALHSDYFVTQITEAFLYKIQAEISDDDGHLFFDLLPCSPRHAIILKDFVILKFLLTFHSENLRKESDLYTDVQPDLVLTFINLELNDYVDDPDGRGFEVMHKCLNHRLICLPARNERGKRISNEIETHLIERGIMSEKSRYRSGQTVSDLNDDSFRCFSSNVNTLIAHLAVLEKLGTSMVKRAKCYNATWYEGELTKAEKYHELCPPMLDTVMFGTSTLFDLLTGHQKLRTYVRNETFASVIRNACSNHQLRYLFPYYYKTLMICISRAEQMVKLEDAAIIVIFKIFNSNYNRCYRLARQVVGYLNKQELERLCLYGQIVGYFNEQELARWSLIYK